MKYYYTTTTTTNNTNTGTRLEHKQTLVFQNLDEKEFLYFLQSNLKITK